MPIRSLTFIYDADGSLAGELKYWLGSWVGATHCALCDITHTKFRKRPSYVACATRLGLQIKYLHRDQLDADLKALTAGNLPCVVGHHDDGDVVLLGERDLEALSGDVGRFDVRLRQVLADSVSDGGV